MKKIILSSILGFIILAVSSLSASTSTNLVKNGDFEDTEWTNLPTGWDTFSHPNHLDRVNSTVGVISGDYPFLRIIRNENGTAQYGQQIVPLDRTIRNIEVSVWVRTENMVIGDPDWQAPALTYAWVLPNDGVRNIGPGQWLIQRAANSDWTKLENRLTKPDDAIGIRLGFQGIGWTGQADFARVSVVPVR
jgi:hypothetical protein